MKKGQGAEKFAVVDLETTGNFASGHRIVEVGIVLINGIKKVDEYHTLVNPGRHIPSFITGLTGIRRSMVEQAPTFSEIAGKIEELTTNRIFVAHNVNFDYSFLQHEMELCGISFERRRLCTMRAVRSQNPGAASYSLSALCRTYHIKRTQDHRALADARAAAGLLCLTLEQLEPDARSQWLRSQTVQTALPASITKEEIEEIPGQPGIYFFSNAQGRVVYIGKARNLKKRVKSHFTATRDNVKKQRFIREVAQVEYQLSGSELIALLWEDHEIKARRPELNYAQKRRVRHFGIYIYENMGGQARVAIQPVRISGSQPLHLFLSYSEAREWLLQKLIEEEISLEVTGWPCDADSESARIPTAGELRDVLISDDQDKKPAPFEVIFENGRSREERAFICRHEGKYVGFGFYPGQAQPQTFEDIEPYLCRARNSRLTDSLVTRLWQESAGEAVVLEPPEE